MKHFIRLVIVLVSILIKQNLYASTDFSKGSRGNNTSSVDVMDTVVFDISQSVIAGNKVSFPVSIISDDTIYALDFSFMYDQANFSFDSIIQLINLELIHHDTSGTLYFSSYSLQEIPHNTNLLTISLNMLGHFLCSDDLNSALVYLNGDACSVKIVECLTDPVPENESGNIHLYPNPTSDFINVNCNLNAEVKLQDLKGSIVFSAVNDQQNDALRIDVSQLPKGMYVMSIQENEKISFQKIIVE